MKPGRFVPGQSVEDMDAKLANNTRLRNRLLISPALVAAILVGGYQGWKEYKKESFVSEHAPFLDFSDTSIPAAIGKIDTVQQRNSAPMYVLDSRYNLLEDFQRFVRDGEAYVSENYPNLANVACERVTGAFEVNEREFRLSEARLPLIRLEPYRSPHNLESSRPAPVLVFSGVGPFGERVEVEYSVPVPGQ